MEVEKRNFLEDIDAFRGLAIILVVLTHMRSTILPDWYYYLVGNATVFFVFVGGYLFKHLFKPDVSYLSFVQKKLMRLVLPYLIASIPGIIYVIVNTQNYDLWYYIKSILTGVGHYNDTHWYIPFIMLVFLTYPLLRLLAKKTIVLTVLTAVSMAISLFTYRSWGNGNPLLSLVHLYGVFLFGMLYSTHAAQIEAFLKRFAWLVLPVLLALAGLSFAFILPSFFYIMEPVWNQGIVALNMFILGKILLIVPILAALRWLIGFKWPRKFFHSLAKKSFGIFFWHTYIIYFYNEYLSAWVPQDNWPVYLLQTGGVFLILYLFLNLSKRIFGNNSAYLTAY